MLSLLLRPSLYAKADKDEKIDEKWSRRAKREISRRTKAKYEAMPVTPEEEEEKKARAKVVERLARIPIMHEGALLSVDKEGNLLDPPSVADEKRRVMRAAIEGLCGARKEDPLVQFCVDTDGAIIDALSDMGEKLKSLEKRLQEAREIVVDNMERLGVERVDDVLLDGTELQPLDLGEEVPVSQEEFSRLTGSADRQRKRAEPLVAERKRER